MSHPDAETLMRHLDGLLTGEAAGEVARHLAECDGCRERGRSARAFWSRLNTEWLGARLASTMPAELGCPSPHELGRYFLDELEPAARERVTAHLDGCPRCRETLAEMEEGAAELQRADPLRPAENAPGVSWWARLQAALGLMPGPAWAGATVAVGVAFVLGLLVRPMLMGPPAVDGVRVAKPAFTPRAELPVLGIAPAVKPEAERRFREAMAFHDAPDFPDRALPGLKEAVALDPSYDLAQFWLGITYLLKNETTAAIPALEEAARLAPGNREYKQYLLWAYLKAGATDKALRLQMELLAP